MNNQCLVFNKTLYILFYPFINSWLTIHSLIFTCEIAVWICYNTVVVGYISDSSCVLVVVILCYTSHLHLNFDLMLHLECYFVINFLVLLDYIQIGDIPTNFFDNCGSYQYCSIYLLIISISLFL